MPSGAIPKNPFRTTLSLLGELHSKRVDLYLHQQGLDTTTPSGKAMFGMFAEFERAMIQGRVKARMARAKAVGKQVGRLKIAAEVEQSIREALQAGRGIISTAKVHGAGVSAVQREALVASECSQSSW
jgi:DNA invertase Pin-like site-specific DNA recombinase